ncbi:hypothetical protein JDV02_003110 [Purpureocillium takamizusanense]|uniref:Uncharacterized protein n=1 Tax=Purpureocillium takamizusanense TaxID=2060973 RepID=A0A9Q8QD37_9HYPO|nr:uncharacterized protein JDV02_003110 [Purpureocillium takamizusanense]UNI16696.1 hypothetical protein JDV02_003110 [Purpureocillium takamizusanense]
MDTDAALASLLTEYEIGVKQRQDTRTYEDKGLEKDRRRTLKCIDEEAAEELLQLEEERDGLLNRVTDFEKELLALYQDLADREKQCSDSREATKARKGKETELYEIKQMQLLQERAAEDDVHRSALLQGIQPSTVGNNDRGLIIVGAERGRTMKRSAGPVRR